jgi:hypothetical protein
MSARVHDVSHHNTICVGTAVRTANLDLNQLVTAAAQDSGTIKGKVGWSGSVSRSNQKVPT